MARLELQNLVKYFGPIAAVDGMSLTVEQGEVVSLLGPSGCGKTTTLNMLAGFLQPDAGSILFDGEIIHTLPPERRNTGMVFQNYALFPHMTVADNVAFGLEMRKRPRAEIQVRVSEALDLARLTGFAERYPRQLSGGQQQRVALARALVIEPSLLLLDEPLSNLDASLRDEMRFEIREIQRRVGITMVFVTHDQTEAMAIADRLAIMNRGRIVQDGRPEEIYRAPLDAFVACFIGQANLIPGTVASTSRERIDVAMGDGTVLGAPATNRPVTAGSQVKVVVRPEDLSVSLQPTAGKNSLRATISKAMYLGSSTRLMAQIGDVVVAISMNRPPPGIGPGAEVYLEWDWEHCALVPADAPASSSMPAAVGLTV
jgi:spermidine/putrescine ABC transporter ATP-binding subunit